MPPLAKRLRGDADLAETAAVPEPDGDTLRTVLVRFRKFTDLINRDPTKEGLEQFTRLLKTHPELAFTPIVASVGGDELEHTPLWILATRRNWEYIDVMLDAAETSKGDDATQILVNEVDKKSGETPLWFAVNEGITFEEHKFPNEDAQDAPGQFILVARALLHRLADPIKEMPGKVDDAISASAVLAGFKTRYEANRDHRSFERDHPKWYCLYRAMNDVHLGLHYARPIPSATLKYLSNRVDPNEYPGY
tara:strand:- start:207 stop:956 length:750 start_codon:yes stop_codon:yes gene_type:complete